MSLADKFKTFIIECKRVLLVTKKPSNEEFKAVVKVTGVGTLIIGAIGFIIHVMYLLLR
ncbi:MAG TPA: protein translocase SEC61 complex subunit gamma [Candidatus Nanoarchaeia archaeon]|nr:protein translocase SEC61 complex subunit gamma [Candidatus Nanoarchaeia archaeon]